MTDLVLRSRRVVLPDGERPATVHVRDGRIAAVTDYGDEGTDVPALLPGMVDTHVHVNEPGRTEWEGFATATRAAAAGGVTTIIDMPLNSIPATVSVEALTVKRTAAEAARPPVDVGFWGGAVPGNAPDLPALHEAGVFGFKCFLIDSGVPEFPPLDRSELDRALSTVDALFIVHAEDPAEVVEPGTTRRFTDFVASRPVEAETRAVATAVEAARRHGARVHILHLSAAAALPLIAAAQRDGLRVTAETCPHYLTLDAADVPDGATEYKCCPPIRDAANREALWRGLSAGTISCVVSDHSPCTPDLKVGDFSTAWGGIASVQLGLPLVWTAARERAFPLSDVVRWLATAPADLVGLTHKGRIAVGADADLVAFDPDGSFEVDPARLHHRHPVTPYAGARLSGTVRSTWVRGVPAAPGTGRLITRETLR
ncbi:allantoinase AllB [Virgisporangium ochraceum]